MSTTAVILVLLSTFLHAGWNLLLGTQKTSYMLLHISLIVFLAGIGPVLFVEFWGEPLPTQVWGYLIVTGIFQAIYGLGLTRGYQHGDFTVVYPIARALPILILAVIDVLRGYAPSPVAWVGMILVLTGCLMVPQRSLQNLHFSHYLNRAMFWVLVTAIGTIGYTTVDNAAAAYLPVGPVAAARYGIFEFGSAALFYWLILVMLREPTGGGNGWRDWKVPVFGAVGLFGAYWLILWSYQLSAHTSYVVALRQFSIVIGVVFGVIHFRDPAPRLRISASLAIVAGIACIALGG
jgi:drug/metabolite transporter (DMT)-like permease